MPALVQRKEHILLFQTTAIQGEVTLHIHGLPSYASCARFRVPQLVPLENNCHQITFARIEDLQKTGVGSVKRKAHSPGASTYCDASNNQCRRFSLAAHSNSVNKNGEL